MSDCLVSPKNSRNYDSKVNDSHVLTNSWMLFPFFLSVYKNSKMKNYNSKREDLEEEDQGEDERNVIL